MFQLPGHRIERASADVRVGEGFLGVRESRLRVGYADGTASDEFPYSIIDRTRLDAVVIAPHFVGPNGVRYVCLRSALRPPVALRSTAPGEEGAADRGPFERSSTGELWELPAGLVEVEERSPEGVRNCAQRELLEEMGYAVPPEALRPLGKPMFPAPGMIAERQFFFEVTVDPATRRTPTEDGSALERSARLVEVPLEDALAACRTGVIEDSKTELGLRRLAEL
ncbi:MAG: NUDIX hydrolase [Polyangiaceae bacterium]